MDSDRPEPIRVTPIPPESVPPSSADVPPPTGNVPPPPPVTPPPGSPPPPVQGGRPSPAQRAPTGSDKVWAILSHLSFLVGFWFVIPVVVYLAMRHECEYAAGNAREALNFHLSLLIYGIGCALLALTIIAAPLAALLAIAMAICGIILAIIAAIKASEGVVYQYPLTIRLIH